MKKQYVSPVMLTMKLEGMSNICQASVHQGSADGLFLEGIPGTTEGTEGLWID